MKYLLGLIFVVIVGCSASQHFTSKGEELYYEKCSGCHRPYTKSELSAENWKMKIDEMSKKAKLTEDEKKIVLSYLSE